MHIFFAFFIAIFNSKSFSSDLRTSNTDALKLTVLSLCPTTLPRVYLTFPTKTKLPLVKLPSTLRVHPTLGRCTPRIACARFVPVSALPFGPALATALNGNAARTSLRPCRSPLDVLLSAAQRSVRVFSRESLYRLLGCRMLGFGLDFASFLSKVVGRGVDFCLFLMVGG